MTKSELLDSFLLLKQKIHSCKQGCDSVIDEMGDLLGEGHHLVSVAGKVYAVYIKPQKNPQARTKWWMGYNELKT